MIRILLITVFFSPHFVSAQSLPELGTEQSESLEEENKENEEETKMSKEDGLERKVKEVKNVNLDCTKLMVNLNQNLETKSLTTIGAFNEPDYIAFKGIKTADETLFIFVCGEQIECVDSKSYLLLDFGVGKNLKIMNSSFLNCSGRFSFTRKEIKTKIKLFESFPLLGVKLVSGTSFIEKKLSKKQGIEIFNKMHCLLQA